MGEVASTWLEGTGLATGFVSFMDRPLLQKALLLQTLGLSVVISRRELAVVLAEGATLLLRESVGLSCAKSIVRCEICKLKGVCLIHHRLKVALKALGALDKLEKFEAGISEKDMEELRLLAQEKKHNG